MSAEQLNEATIFNAARQIESLDERAAFLAESCGDDAALRERIEKLLAAFAEESQFLEQPAPGLAETMLTDSAGENLAASLDAGLAPAFGEEAVVVIGNAGHSVLQSLGRTLNMPRVVLRESQAEGDDPITRPKSPEMPDRDSDSRYHLHGEIARGGMGAIIKGRDTDLGRDLAIKVLLDSHKDKPEVIQRFVEEAQIGGQLQHPGIAPVYELGQFSDKRPFFAMKLVKGQTLSKLLADREDSAVERAKFIGIFEQVCQTMAYAHSRGVIHRDLKPANIMVGAFGEVQVMDWGLAKVIPAGGVADEKQAHNQQQGQSIIQTLRSGVGSDAPAAFGSVGSQTQMGSVMGTPAYMPPEQALGEIDNMDERADVFGLGAILCEILTGKPPYVADDGTRVFRMASRGKLDNCFERLDECGADADLVAIARKCLELEPTDRPRDAGVLAEQVTVYLESVETRLREAEVQRATEAARADAEAAQAAAERQKAEAEAARAKEANKRRQTSLALAASILLLVCLGGGGWLSMERQEANRQTAVADKQRQHAEEMQTFAEQRDEQRKAAESAQEVAETAEQKGRQLLYSTDMQLVAALLKDDRANARDILSRLNAHDPNSPDNIAGEEDLRGFEWYYFQKLIASRSKIFSDLQHDVVACTVTAQDELVVLDSEGQVSTFDLQTRQSIRPTVDLGQGQNIGAMAISRDGQRVALAIGDQVHLFDSASGEQTADPIAVTTNRRGLLFSPDGEMLITVHTGVGWWDSTTGKLVAERDFKLELVNNNWFGQTHSVAEDGLVLSVGGQTNGFACNSFSVFRLNKETAEITQLLHEASGGGTKNSVVISPDGQFVGVGHPWSGLLEIYEVSTGKLVQSHPRAHATDIRQIAFDSSSSKMVTAASDGTIKVWGDFLKLESYREHENDRPGITGVTRLSGHVKQVDVLGFFDSGKHLVSACQDRTVRIWNLENRTDSLHQSVTDSPGARASISADGALTAFSGDREGIRLRDASTGEIVAVLPQRDDAVPSQSVAFSHDNRLLAVGYGGKNKVSDIELWDIDRRERLVVLPGSTAVEGFVTTKSNGVVTGLAFSPDGKHLAASFGALFYYPNECDVGNFPILIYDVAAGQPVQQLQGHRSYCVSVRFSSDGTRLASASFDGTARIWDAETWSELHVLENGEPSNYPGQIPRVFDVAFSPDGELLAMAGSGGSVIVWNVASGAELQILRGHVSTVRGVAFFPNGRTLASASVDGSIRLWNTDTWRELLAMIPGRNFQATSVAFSPNGDRLLATNGSGDALIWSTAAEGAVPFLDAQQISAWLEAGLDFQQRIRMFSENMRLHESLARMPPQHLAMPQVQSALAATRANWHASHGRWKEAVAECKRLRGLSNHPAGSWLKVPGLLRLAHALLEQNQPDPASELIAAAVAHARDKVSPQFGSQIALIHSDVARLLAEDSDNIALRRIRANLFGLEGNYVGQIADLTAVVESLSRQSNQGNASERAQLYRNRGDAYFSTSQWQAAVDDYAQIVNDGTTDETLLTNHATALGNAMLERDLLNWHVLEPEDMRATVQTEFTRKEDGSILAGQSQGESNQCYTLSAHPGVAKVSAIRLEVLPDDSLPNKGSGWHPAGNFHLIEFQAFARKANDGESRILAFHEAWASYSWPTREISRAIDGDMTSEWHAWSRQTESHETIFSLVSPLSIDVATELVIQLQQRPGFELGRFRLSVSNAPDAIVKTRIRQATQNLTNPWGKLAAAFYLAGENARLQQLMADRPTAAASIGGIHAEVRNWQAAVDALSTLIVPQTTDPTLLANRARAYMGMQKWKPAKVDWLRAIELDPHQLQRAFTAYNQAEQWSDAVDFGLRYIDAKPADQHRWKVVAPVLVLAGQRKEYAGFCKRAAEQFADTREPTVSEGITKSLLLLLPQAIEPDKLPTQPFVESLENGTATAGQQPWFWTTRALLAYRTGDAKSSVQYATHSEEHKPIEVSHALARSVLALAQHESGNTAEAATALQQATQLLEELEQNTTGFNSDLQIARILHREAKAKINGKTDSTDGASTSESSDKTPAPSESTDKDIPDKN